MAVEILFRGAMNNPICELKLKDKITQENFIIEF